MRTWPAHFKAVSALTFAAEGSLLVSGGEDTVVNVWALYSLLDAAGGGGGGAAPTPLYAWSDHTLPVAALACSAGGGGGGALVASASADRTCKLWTLTGGHLLRTLRFPVAVCAVTIEPCEATLYAGGADGRIFQVPLNAAPPPAAAPADVGAMGGSSGGAGDRPRSLALRGDRAGDCSRGLRPAPACPPSISFLCPLSLTEVDKWLASVAGVASRPDARDEAAPLPPPRVLLLVAPGARASRRPARSPAPACE